MVTDRGARLRSLVLPPTVYVAAATCFTWPLAVEATDHLVAPAHVAPTVSLLMIWILRWDLHALATDPANLFNGNALYPAPGTLALSEHMLGNLPLFAPVWAATGNPLLALNVVTIASFVLGGLFMHLLARRWTGSEAGAYAAGLAFAFAPWRGPALLTAHVLGVQYLPLILLALDHTATTGSLQSALLTAAVLALQTLASYYLGYVAFLAAGAYLLADLIGRGFRGRLRTLSALGLAVLLPVAVVVPVTLPYLAAKASGVLRTLHGEDFRQALWLTGGPTVVARDWVGWPATVLGLAGAGRLVRLWGADRTAAVRVLGLVLTALLGFLLVPGPDGPWGMLPLFDLLALVVPGFGNLRVTPRFGILASFGLSALTAFGVASLLRLLAGRRAASAPYATVAAVAAVAAFAPLRPLPRLASIAVPVGTAIPPAYRWLAEHGRGEPLLELPDRAGLYAIRTGARAMYFSTYHWLPLLNGWSGYIPRSFGFLIGQAERLPDDSAIQALVDCTGLRWILLHDPTPRQQQTWATFHAVRLQSEFANGSRSTDRLYEVVIPPRGGCPPGLF